MYKFIENTKNKKTGPVAVTYSHDESCPTTCELKDGGCYGDLGHMLKIWRTLEGTPHMEPYHWESLMISLQAYIKREGRLQFYIENTLTNLILIRHNILGDLPHKNNRITRSRINDLFCATQGALTWCYSHHDPTIKHNRNIIKEYNVPGRFVINLSANNLNQAQQYKDLKIGPVTTLLPHDHEGSTFKMPDGSTGVVCLFMTKGINCKQCGLCFAESATDVVVGFPGHGSRKKQITEIFHREAQQ